MPKSALLFARPLLLALLLVPRVAQGDPAASERADSLREQSSTTGSTGLLHLADPLASAGGTFRLSFLLDTYGGKGFLCNANTPCPGIGEDSSEHFGTTFNLAVAPLSFLEGYASLTSYANSNDARTPSLISAVGNTKFGLKGFTPSPLGGIFRFGGAAELGFLGSSGGVGVAGSGTSLRVLGLALADFRGADLRGLPLRAHLNVGYFLDNSGVLAADVEAERGAPITRIERYGLTINRVDQVQLGFGLDALLGVVRPFAEWNLGVPLNRQGYHCDPTLSFSGDKCLKGDSRFSAFPSKLTLGARVFPWLTGLAATAAFDIGTTGTSNFIEELAPTMPWDLWLGLSYGFDVTPPPPPVVKEVAKSVVAPPPLELRLRGFVHEKGKSEGIGKAIVSYDGRSLTSMATGPDGHFTSEPLEPGTYTLSIEASDYEPAQCSGTLTLDVDTPKKPDLPATAPSPAQQENATAAASAPATSPRYFDVDCELTARPTLGTLSGQVRDPGGAAVAGAPVKLRDNLGRELSLATDTNGSFHFGGIVPGRVLLAVDADGYLFHAETVEIGARADVRLDVGLRNRPKPPHVRKTAKELVLTQPIRFQGDATEPAPDTASVLEEVADALERSPGIGHVEIGVYTDASGNPEHDSSLTEQRASAIRAWLVEHGVEEARLSARGYGSSAPVSPNVTPAGRARNRRVKFVISP
jgi:outer membrane protein OmpA-like peptidoglycan-associated protein